MLAIAPLSEYDEENETQYREDVRRRLDKTWKRNGNVIIPYGYLLGFTGEDGSPAAFKYDAGTLQIVIDGITVVSFATDAALLALEAAYQAADTTLQANITAEASTRATADSAEASARTSADATLQTNINTVSASVTTETTARVNADLALASSITSLTSAYQAADTTLQANITAEASTRASADTAIASSVTTLTATVNAKNQTFRQTSAPSAIAAGDLWIDTDDSNKLYQATAPGAGSWVASDDSRIATTAASVTNIAEAYATNNGSTARLVWEVAVGTNVATIVQTAAAGYADGTWNGSAITLSAAYITLDALAINFGADTTYEDVYNTLYTVSGSYRYRDRGPFGASGDLLQWFGLNSVPLNSETKTNGIWAMATDGNVYYGAAPLTATAPLTVDDLGVLVAATGSLGDPTLSIGPVSPNVNGGTAPYTYFWEDMEVLPSGTGGTYQVFDCSDNTDATPTFTGVYEAPPGAFATWRVTVRDAVGASVQMIFYMEAPSV